MSAIRISIILVIALIWTTNAAQADGDAIFGVQWGATADDLSQLGLSLGDKSRQGNLSIYSKVTGLPKGLSDAETYSFILDDNLGLVKIVMVSKNFTNDAYGSEGKDRFAELKSILIGKYTLSDGGSMEVVGLKLWDEADEFYQCLAYSGCGMWSAIFDAPNMTVGLVLKGLSRGEGYYTLSAEADPEFAQALQRLKSANKADEEDAL